jgi:hypothetical protein
MTLVTKGLIRIFYKSTSSFIIYILFIQIVDIL